MAMRTYKAAALLLVLVAAALVAGCDDDGGGGPVAPLITQVPESWRGVWSVQLRGVFCNTAIVLLDTTVTQDICPGDSLSLPFDLGGSLCADGSLRATETSIQFTCDGPYQQVGCTGTMAMNLTISIAPAAGTMQGQGQAYVDFSNCPDLCLDLVITGNRIPGDPTCAAPKTESPLLAALRRAPRP
jgi:hypothetical protein